MPAVPCQQRLEPESPVQRKILFITIIKRAPRARVLTSMPRVYHNNRRATLRARDPTRPIFAPGTKQRLNRFFQIQRMNEGLPIDELRGKTQPQLQSVPVRRPALSPQHQHSVRARKRVGGNRCGCDPGQRPRSCLFGPSFQRNPGLPSPSSFHGLCFRGLHRRQRRYRFGKRRGLGCRNGRRFRALPIRNVRLRLRCCASAQRRNQCEEKNFARVEHVAILRNSPWDSSA